MRETTLVEIIITMHTMKIHENIVKEITGKEIVAIKIIVDMIIITSTIIHKNYSTNYDRKLRLL